jgi:4-amino-4-deoxy-L-arabinose transferase-like glycosyltransferase
LTTVLFFSLSPGKRTVYVLPMFPALALIAALGLEHLRWSWPRYRWLICGPVLAMAVVLSALAVAMAALPAVADSSPDLVETLEEHAVLGADLPFLVAIMLGVLGAGLLGSGIGWLRGRHGLAAGSLVSALVLLILVAATFVIPRFDRIKSARELSSRLLAVSGPGDTVGIYQRLDPRFLFHTKRFVEVIETRKELVGLAGAPHRLWVLAERDDIAEMDLAGIGLVEVARDADPVDGYLLLRNRAVGERSAEPSGKNEERPGEG